jgi:hypothetical protein
MGDAIAQAVLDWLRMVASTTLPTAINAAGELLFQTPQFDQIAEVRSAWQVARGVADALFVLAVLAVAVLVMSKGAFETSYTIKQLLPRLVLALLLSNASLAICGALIRLDNALVTALVGNGAATTAWSGLTNAFSSSSGATDVLLALVAIAAAVLAVLLVVVYLARDLLLLLLTVLAPLALLAQSLPVLDELARVWWRGYCALLFLQVGHAVLVTLGVRLATNTAWLGTPASALISGLVVATLLYLMVKLPFVAYRWAFQQRITSSPVVEVARFAKKAAVVVAAVVAK